MKFIQTIKTAGSNASQKLRRLAPMFALLIAFAVQLAKAGAYAFAFLLLVGVMQHVCGAADMPTADVVISDTNTNVITVSNICKGVVALFLGFRIVKWIRR